MAVPTIVRPVRPRHPRWTSLRLRRQVRPPSLQVRSQAPNPPRQHQAERSSRLHRAHLPRTRQANPGRTRLTRRPFRSPRPLLPRLRNPRPSHPSGRSRPIPMMSTFSPVLFDPVASLATPIQARCYCRPGPRSVTPTKFHPTRAPRRTASKRLSNGAQGRYISARAEVSFAKDRFTWLQASTDTTRKSDAHG